MGAARVDAAARARAARARSARTSTASRSPASGRGCAFACRSRWPHLRPRGSGMSRWRTPATTLMSVDLIYAQDVALAHYGAVRLNEYYVSQYVDHTPLQHPSRGARARSAAEPRGRWAPPLARASDRCATARASAPTRSSFTGLPRALAGRLPRCKPSACRACAASTSIRWRCCRMRRCRSRPRRARALRLLRAGSSPIIRAPAAPPTSASPIARWRCPKPCLAAGSAAQHRPRAATLFSDAPAAGRDTILMRAMLTRHFGARPPGGRGGRRAAPVLLPRATARMSCCRPRSARACGPHGQILRTGDQLVPDEASLTTTVVDGRRLPFDAHAGPRQHQSLPLDDALVPRAVPLARPAACSSSVTARGICSASRRRSR